jgi:hypothetical protein
MRTRSILFSVLVLAVGATSCSTGSAPPRPGTPAYYWAGAQEAYRNGDFSKADINLEEIVGVDSEFTVRARPWQIAISAGLAQGYSEMADNYEKGGRANRENPMPFHKQVTNLRSLASAAAMELAEGAHGFMAKDKDPNVVFAFAFPAGAAAQPAALRKVATGMLIQDSERESMQIDMLQRGVLLSLCRTTGNPDDPAKTLDRFKAGEVRIPREVFLFAVAQALAEQSELYGARKLDHPGRFKVMCQEALAALEGIPQTKETKALTTKLQASLKKIRST